MILETLQTAFERKTVSKVAYTLCYMVVLVIAVNSFNIAIGYAKDAIDRMIDFMMAMIPLLFALLASMGNIVTVSVTHPLIVFMIHTVGTLIHTVVFPLLFFSAVLHLVSALSEKYKLTQLANLLRNIGAGLLGVLLTVFLGVISVRGITSSVTDGVTIRAAKYITGNFVPVIGKMFADATDTVISASLLVKNAIGLSGSDHHFVPLRFSGDQNSGACSDLQCSCCCNAAIRRDADCGLPPDHRKKHGVRIRCFGSCIVNVFYGRHDHANRWQFNRHDEVSLKAMLTKLSGCLRS